MEKSASEKNSASENRRNVFLEALQAGTADTETGETRAAAEETPEEASGNAVPEETEEETGELEEAVVPAGDPDMSGRLALRILKILKIVCRPLGKLANTFLAPVLKPFRKSADRITRRDWALFLALIAVIGVSVAAPMWIVRAQNTCRVEESLYVSTMGQLFTWEEGGVFYCEDTVTTFTPADGEALTLSGTPFYYSDGSGLLWPNLGVWYSVEKDKSWGRVSRFSQVSAEQGSCVITTAKGGGIPEDRIPL